MSNNRALIKYVGSTGLKSLPDMGPAIDQFVKTMKNISVAPMIAGPAIGAIGGTLLTGKDKRTSEQIAKDKKEIKKIKDSMTVMDHLFPSAEAYRKKKKIRELASPLNKKIWNAITGANIGLGVGALLQLAIMKPLMQRAEKVDDVLNRRVINYKGNINIPPEAKADIFEKAHHLIINDTDPVVINGVAKMPKDIYKSVLKNVKIEAARDRINKRGFGFNINFPTADRHAEAYENIFINRFQKAFKGTDAGSGVSHLVKKLSDEGIKSHKEFAAKYHPDINKNIPKEIKENFGQILQALRKNHTGDITDVSMKTFVDKFRESNDPEVLKVYESLTQPFWKGFFRK